MILVLTTFRSGSTWYCNDLAEKYGYINYDEPFNVNHKGSHTEHLRSIISNPNSIVKFMPQQDRTADMPGLLDKLVSLATEIHVLVRKDFNAQVRSHYAARYLGGMYKIGWTTEYSEPKDVHYNELLYQTLEREIFAHIVELSRIYHKLGSAKLVFTEDFTTQHKYNRPITWSEEPKIRKREVAHLFEE